MTLSTIAAIPDKLTIAEPQPAEHAEYFAKYLSLAPSGQAGALIVNQIVQIDEIFSGLNRQTAQTVHEPWRWSLNQVLGHLIDCERVFGYRAARIAGNDAIDLPGFDENGMVQNANYHSADTGVMLEEWKALRVANIKMFSRLTAEQMGRSGTVSGNRMSARAAALIIVGHLEHHLKIIRDRLGIA